MAVDLNKAQTPLGPTARIAAPKTPGRTVTPFKASERLQSLSKTPVYVKALIQGDSGVGKTWVAATSPNPLLVLSEWAVSRLTLERLKRDYNIDPDVITIESEDDAIEAAKYARAHADNYETLVLDGITDVNDRIMREVLGEMVDKPRAGDKTPHDPDVLEMGDWNRVLQRTMTILLLFRDFPGHTVVTSLSTDELMKIVPMVYPKSLRKRISSLFSLVGYLDVDLKPGKPSTRKLYCDASTTFTAKNGGGFVPSMIENPNMTDIIKLITAAQSGLPAQV